MGLWHSKAQKVQRGLAPLCLNLSPTSFLPSSSARCFMQGTGSGSLSRSKWVVNTRGEVHRLTLPSEQNRELCHGSLGPISLDQVGVGKHDSLEAGAHGPWQSSVPFSLAGSTEDVDERVGLGPAGKSCFGQWADPALWISSGPSLALLCACPFCSCLLVQVVPLGVGGVGC